MYDRYTIFCETAELEKFFSLSIPEAIPVNYNAHPTSLMPVVTNSHPLRLQFFHWGQTQQLGNNKALSPRLFNLTKDSAFSRPALRRAIKSNRCVIPANGFYVWKQVSKKQKIPYFCHFPNFTPFGIAGVYEEFEDIEDTPSHTFNMITIPSASRLATYQDDMPALLTKEQSAQWLGDLEEREAQEILESIGDQKLMMHSVSPRLADLTNNDKGLIQPAAPSDQFGNYTLFS